MKVSVKSNISFSAESQLTQGDLEAARKEINEMFHALERYENEKGIALSNIRIETIEDSISAKQFKYKYKISADYSKES